MITFKDPEERRIFSEKSSVTLKWVLTILYLLLLDSDDASCALGTRVRNKRAENASNLAIKLKIVTRNFVSIASMWAMKLRIVLGDSLQHL